MADAIGDAAEQAYMQMDRPGHLVTHMPYSEYYDTLKPEQKQKKPTAPKVPEPAKETPAAAQHKGGLFAKAHEVHPYSVFPTPSPSLVD